jgi:hypothetical protein
VVSVVAPPFERFFVEFDIPDSYLGLPAWGVLFTEREPQHEEEGWLMTATLVAEWRRAKPIGPVMEWVIPLDRNGLLFAGDPDGYGSLYGQVPEIERLPEQVAFDVGEGFGRQLGSALFAISLMHCKNVDVQPVDPPERLSRKHERKHGHPLTRYYVLDIKPMRRVLDSDGEARTKGLAHALHICRGHFKTHTPEAPLFGMRVGTYWWASQVRGKAEQGVVEKDYRQLVGDVGASNPAPDERGTCTSCRPVPARRVRRASWSRTPPARRGQQ